MAVDGLDVSAEQGQVDWGVAPGVLGIAKATEGTYYQDAQLHPNFNGMVNSRKRPGCYHFIRAGTNWAEQADYFFDFLMGTWGKDQILALDLEPYPGEPWPLGPDETVTNTLLFLETVHARAGVTPWLYTYPSFMQMLSIASHFDDLAAYPLWWADPSSQNPAPWPPALIQTGQGQVPGVAGDVDLNSLGPAYANTLPIPPPPKPRPKDEPVYFAFQPGTPDIYQFGDTKRHVSPDEWAFRSGPYGGNPYSTPPGGPFNALTITQAWFDSVPTVA